MTKKGVERRGNALEAVRAVMSILRIVITYRSSLELHYSKIKTIHRRLKKGKQSVFSPAQENE